MYKKEGIWDSASWIDEAVFNRTEVGGAHLIG